MIRCHASCVAVVLALMGFAAPLAALELDLPASARLTLERASPLDSYDLPIAPFDGVSVPSKTMEGRVLRRSWRISAPGLTPLQVITPLRDQLQAQGFDLAFECDARVCGGFDFRFNIEVLPGPNMYVNISQYRYLTAFSTRTNGPGKAVGVLVSTTASSSYVQVVLVDEDMDVSAIVPKERPIERETMPKVQDAEQGVQLLRRDGRYVLPGLEFSVGTSDLGPGPFSALKELSDFLTRSQDMRVALVGHTDATGTLAANISLSRARARSVRSRLIETYGVSPDQVDAEGMGYLAPIASNLTEEGRRLNRRVEVVLLNTQ
ncbi:OmpA family protein [Roseobacter denitrificans]|uniref:OmpA family domain protein n=1 Tax=Roseobacter denitrificans (strain ATCC 33942 / OCh 114) TaxID=375451 RepID=Q16BM1_ROSDO|nr:OmpA family protein [Roseobacter denitrificans]ABG30622.1 OmpA family domain protein [Roseobacter denitrificans OCh 114]AVL53758.1 OmpA family protein [Roseobacter denitrificans]SFG19295.1 OmpA-OmpF porin, OOP family [Roseobacter denitrificans OCh 114]